MLASGHVPFSFRRLSVPASHRFPALTPLSVTDLQMLPSQNEIRSVLEELWDTYYLYNACSNPAILTAPPKESPLQPSFQHLLHVHLVSRTIDDHYHYHYHYALLSNTHLCNSPDQRQRSLAVRHPRTHAAGFGLGREVYNRTTCQCQVCSPSLVHLPPQSLLFLTMSTVKVQIHAAVLSLHSEGRAILGILAIPGLCHGISDSDWAALLTTTNGGSESLPWLGTHTKSI